MATRRVNRAPAPEPDEYGAPAEYDMPPASPEDELGEVLAELGQGEGGKVRIERRRDDNRFEFVQQQAAAAFSLERLQQDFGGGEYRVTVRDAGGKYKGSKTILIAQPTAPPAASPAAAGPLAEVAELLKQQQQLLGALLVGGGKLPGQAPAPDADAIRRNLLQDMAAMRELLGAGAGPGLGIKDMLELLQTGMNLAREGGGGDGDGWARPLERAIEVFGQPLAQVLEHAAQQRAAAPAPSVTRAPAAPTLDAPGATPGALDANKEGGAMKFDLKTAVAFLVERAQQDSDPVLYADLILDNVPPAMLRAVLGQGTDPGPVVERLASLDPRVKESAQWFRDLGAAVLEGLNGNARAPGGDSDPGDPASAP